MRRYIQHGSWARMAAATLLGALLLSGCGGSSGGSGNPITTGNLTRASSNNYSQDAKILASREATDAWIPEATTKAIEEDLKLVRAQFTKTTDIHARPDGDLFSVIVGLDPNAPWRAAWEAGTLTTGDAAVDNLLKTYKATRVQKITDLGDYVAFTVYFEDPLNPVALARLISPASSSFRRVDPNNLIGDGDQITRQTSDSARVYTFSRGWGDCPAGCIYRHNYKVTISADGTMKDEESGDTPNDVAQ